MSELEYYSPGGKYAVRQALVGPDNHFDKIEIVDVVQHKVLFTLQDEVTYATGSEYENVLGWRGENDLYLFVMKGCVNPTNNPSTNEIIHISLEEKAVVERYHPQNSGGIGKLLVGYVIRRSPDKKCYIKVSGSSQITVYFRDTKCVFNGVTPLLGYPFLAKWSPNCNACCFMGKYEDDRTRLISIYKTSDSEAGMDAWNLGKVPHEVKFEEREGMSDLCVPVIQGTEIYKRPFYYDDSIYKFTKLTSRLETAEQPKPSVSQPLSAHNVKTKSEKKISRILRGFFNDVVFVFKYLGIKLSISIIFLLAVLVVMFIIAGLLSLFEQ